MPVCTYDLFLSTFVIYVFSKIKYASANLTHTELGLFSLLFYTHSRFHRNFIGYIGISVHVIDSITVTFVIVSHNQIL